MTALLALLVISVLFLAYSNGANDNFKGVATLYGSRTCGYRTALAWATVTTLAGSLLALVLADGLVRVPRQGARPRCGHGPAPGFYARCESSNT